MQTRTEKHEEKENNGEVHGKTQELSFCFFKNKGK